MAYVFISYSSKNQMAADHFKKILDCNGIHSWMAPGDIPLGSKYAQVINKAIRNSSGLLLLLTDNAQKSIWVPKEVERAINYQKPLIPVMLEDVILNDEFEFYICNDQGIAISQIDEKTPEMQQVLAILRKITSEENSQEVVSQYIVAKTPKMKRKLWLKRAAALLTALVMIGVGVGIGHLFRFDREEPAQPVSAAVTEDAEWHYNAGVLFENSSPAHLEDALKSYLAAARGGYTRSYLAVGRVSMELEQYAQAAEYLKKATAYYDDAYVLLGRLYEEGLGVERSLKEAESLYQHGHQLNDNDATCALARLYASAPEGSGITADVELAKQLYAGIADKHPESAFRLGLLYESSDRELAIQWMKKAYERGYAAAEYRLSELLPPDELAALQAHAADPGAEHAEMSTTLSDEALTIQKPDNTAEVLLRAAQGDLQAKLEAACLYYNGSEEDKIPVDHRAALANLLAAGDEVYTHADAMMILAYYYEGNEDVVDADIGKAVKLYTEAANKGNLTACYRLARGYCEGDLNGGTPDYREGYGWAFQGAQKENPGCMNALGIIYHKGRLTGEPDIEEALKWYIKAAELEFPAAMMNLGRGYADGTLNGGTPDYGIAKDWYVKAAELEYASAMYNLGRGYADGTLNGGMPDYGIAKDWLFKAAERGSSNAMTSIGFWYNDGTFNDGVPDDDEALKWYKQAADLGNSTAIQNIAECYENGKFSGGTPNYEEAASWFREAADKGMAHSMYHLGRGYANGNYNGGTPDYTKAVEWYEKAAEQDDEKSLVALAKLYLSGKKDKDGKVLFEVNRAEGLRLLEKLSELGTEDTYVLSNLGWFYAGNSEVLEADYARSVEYYEAAAKLGDAYSMHNLGLIYQDARLGEPDYKMAEKWFLDAAKLGYSSSMFSLGYGYYEGYYGDAPDYDKSLEWYTKAAEQNHSVAMNNLGVGYYHGNFNGGTPDYAKAMEWYTAAADLNYALAMKNIGVNYENGSFNGGVPDYVTAKEWYEKAAALDNAEAKFQLGYGYYYSEYGDAPDYDKALEWYLAAAEQGHSVAMNNLGVGYCNGNFNGGTPDYAKALEWYTAAAELNYALAMRNIAENYADGDFNGGIPNYAKAVEWYEKAAEQNDMESLVALAKLYLSGKIDKDGNVLFEVNRAEALRLLEKLEELGTEDTYVLAWLGWFYAGNSEVLEADYPKSVAYYEKAAALGDAYSMHQLGSIYRDGRLGEPDYEMAEKWYLDAAELGYSSSMFWLGYGYYEGYYGDAPDYDKSLEWYTKAAEQNDSSAMYNLGVGYENGRYNGGVPDYAKAAEWYEKAAALGHENAIASLADLHLDPPYDENGGLLFETDVEKGLFYFDKLINMELTSTYALRTVGWLYYDAYEGVEHDGKKAAEYYEEAANLGDVHAMNMLGYIYQEGGDKLDRAIWWLKEAVNRDHAESMIDLAQIYMYNLDVEDLAEAEYWLNAALSTDKKERAEELLQELEEMKAE